ncbi:hypothetical protein [Paenibacillus turpanensis]|uniref:hypothetical protein n=1 Tax=Paenibacillus turpanensis TaxID=2689078 RepID=UPI00140D9AB0|nr:hypothetical protein [Paenibacillus turpanensis]
MKFYKINIDEGKRKKYAQGIPLVKPLEENICCSVCRRQWRRAHYLENPNFVMALSNQNFPDFLWFLHYKIISENALEVLMQKVVRNLLFKEISIVSVNDLSEAQVKDLRFRGENVKKLALNPPKYYTVIVEEGAELHKESGVYVEECDSCKYLKVHSYGMDFLHPSQKLYLHKRSWNGEDLFTLKYFPATLYCTENFLKLYNEYRLTGLNFSEIDVIE